MTLRIAWFTQLNPACCSAAEEVSRQLIPLLSNNFEIDIFTNQPADKGELRTTTFSWQSLLEEHLKLPYDILFYQLEDLQESDFIRLPQLLLPGITYFHDVMFRPRSEPDWLLAAKKIAGEIQHEFLGIAESSLPVLSPFCHSEAESSAVSLFSCERNIGEYRRNASSRLSSKFGIKPDVFLLPYPLSEQAIPREITKTEGPLKIACCAPPLLEFRSHCLIKALSKLDRPATLYWLLNQTQQQEAHSLCGEFGLTNVEFSFPRSFSRWREIVRRADIAFHLSFSAYGDPGPWLAQSMFAQAVCAVSDFSSAAMLPDEVVVKIPCGLGEIEANAEVLGGNHRNEAENKYVKKAAAASAYAREHHAAPTAVCPAHRR